MSLTTAQRQRTADELRENLRRSGLTVEALAESLGEPVAVVEDALDSRGNPALTWQLRDLLYAAAFSNGSRPVAYTVLTDSRRVEAHRWFGVPVEPFYRAELEPTAELIDSPERTWRWLHPEDAAIESTGDAGAAGGSGEAAAGARGSGEAPAGARGEEGRGA